MGHTGMRDKMVSFGSVMQLEHAATRIANTTAEATGMEYLPMYD
jgi:hypothetical protein